jgi:hypothetical protein
MAASFNLMSDVLTPFLFPPLYCVKRRKLIINQYITPPLCEAERGKRGEYIKFVSINLTF